MEFRFNHRRKGLPHLSPTKSRLAPRNKLKKRGAKEALDRDCGSTEVKVYWLAWMTSSTGTVSRPTIGSIDQEVNHLAPLEFPQHTSHQKDGRTEVKQTPSLAFRNIVITPVKTGQRK